MSDGVSGDAGLTIVRDAAGVVELRLDRPAVRNALDPALIGALLAALDGLRADSSVRALLVTGAGSDFCSGVDLGWMREVAAMSPDRIARSSLPLQRLYSSLATFPAPALARVQGRVMAGGLGIVAACDVVVAEAGARFAISEARLGLIPALISPFLLRKLGSSVMRAMTLTGLGETADRMLQVGLVHRVGRDVDETTRLVDEAIAGILQGSPDALRMGKVMIDELAGRPMDDAMTRSMAWVEASRGEACAREGVAAFLEKRVPGWSRERPRISSCSE